MRTVTTSEIITAVRRRGGYISDVFPAEESSLIEFIDSAYSEVYDVLAFSFEGFYEVETEFSTTGSVADYPLPTDLEHLIGVDYKISNDDYDTINRYDFSDRNVYNHSVTSGYNSNHYVYRLQGNNIRLQSTPTGGNTIRLTYIPYPTKVSGSSQSLSFHTAAQEELVKLHTLRKVQAADEVSVSSTDKEIGRQMARVKTISSIRDQHQPKGISNIRGKNRY